MKTLNLTNKSVAVISDLHIGHGWEHTDRIQSILDSHDFIIFNGDILELFAHKYDDLAANEAAWLIHWMGEHRNKYAYILGNHDGSLIEIKDRLFFPVYKYIKVISRNKVIMIIHGHQFDKYNEDYRSKFSRWLSLLGVWASRLFNTNIQDWLARKSNSIHIINTFRHLNLSDIRQRSVHLANSQDIDVLIHGHSHFHNVMQADKVTIIDQGGFMIGESFVLISNGEATLKILD